ncbi:MAG: hypothetical protein WAS72_12680 [Saprospiraceae bacterium]
MSIGKVFYIFFLTIVVFACGCSQKVVSISVYTPSPCDILIHPMSADSAKRFNEIFLLDDGINMNGTLLSILQQNYIGAPDVYQFEVDTAGLYYHIEGKRCACDNDFSNAFLAALKKHLSIEIVNSSKIRGTSEYIELTIANKRKLARSQVQARSGDNGMNLDFYSIQINTRPDFNNNGLPDTDVEIFNRFRQEFAEIASGEEIGFDFSCPGASNADINWSFEYYNNSDISRWESSDYLNTVFKINAGGSSFLTNWLGDYGAIIISQATNCCWIGSTIQTPLTGTQPFSGNRQWGFYTNSNGKPSFYTKAADTALTEFLAKNMGSIFNECDDDTYYQIAYETWTNLQQKAITLVNNNGGNATIDITEHEEWNVAILKDKLKSNTPVNFVSCL